MSNEQIKQRLLQLTDECKKLHPHVYPIYVGQFMFNHRTKGYTPSRKRYATMAEAVQAAEKEWNR